MSTKTSNEMEVSINQAKKILHRFLSSEKHVHMPLFLHSPPGLGKSSIVHQLCEDLGYGLQDVRLGCMPEYDVQGIPFVKGQGTDSEEMCYSVPDWFPTDERVAAGLFAEQGVVFLDELSNASFNTQQAAYRIVLDRAVHAAKLAKGWRIVAAGNLKTDNTGAKNILPALASRFATHLYIKPSVEDFIGYAYDKGLRKEIIGFVSFDNSKLYDFDGAKKNTAFACPRTLEYASKLLDLFENDNEMLWQTLSGCIGQANTIHLTTYIKYYEKLPDFSQIMKGKAKYEWDSKDLGLVFAITSSTICCIIENHKDAKALSNLNKVIISKLSKEFRTLIFKSLAYHRDKTIVRDVFLHPECKESFTEVSQHIL